MTPKPAAPTATGVHPVTLAAQHLIVEIKEIHETLRRGQQAVALEPADLSTKTIDDVWHYSFEGTDWHPLFKPLSMRLAFPHRRGPKCADERSQPRFIEPVLRHFAKAGFHLSKQQTESWLQPSEILRVSNLIAVALCQEGFNLSASGEPSHDYHASHGDGASVESYKKRCEERFQIQNWTGNNKKGNPSDYDQGTLHHWLCQVLVGSPDFKSLRKPDIGEIKNGLIFYFVAVDDTKLLIRNVALCAGTECGIAGKTPVDTDNQCEQTQCHTKIAIHEGTESKTGRTTYQVDRGFVTEYHESAYLFQCPKCDNFCFLPIDEQETTDKMALAVLRDLILELDSVNNQTLKENLAPWAYREWVENKVRKLKEWKSDHWQLEDDERDKRRLQISLDLQRISLFPCPECGFSLTGALMRNSSSSNWIKRMKVAVGRNKEPGRLANEMVGQSFDEQMEESDHQQKLTQVAKDDSNVKNAPDCLLYIDQFIKEADCQCEEAWQEIGNSRQLVAVEIVQKAIGRLDQ